MTGEELVEVHPGADHAVGREGGQLGPRQLQPVAGADDAQAVVARPAGCLQVDAHRDELAHRARGGLLQHQHVDAGLGEMEGGGGSGRTGSDDDDVGGRVGGHPGHRGTSSLWLVERGKLLA